MFKKIKDYKLSAESDFDLEAIFNYTEYNHGFNQAVKYLMDLDMVFEQLVLNPELGRKRNELKRGLFSISEQEHTIFYRIMENHIRIVRVLHGSKDLPKHF
ncbi:type II toxin-antitoxin system RelE/ParE family toxin [Algibacter amylolyticus]|uniref:Toxin n=1 Tax=Algibacter amylolyticus TaxID=1608400 RepID=A0A5M7BGZ6_9FLAO|nr:type II toxin-antitoxin system RelE/ParE family toxin [Algibacter amylolyticus]KAA5827667.1 type II toxin-antitoxin system RelE/ParE family toxin [Algibacter amylolyticus]MBB5266882.1 toxin ParE1/3/4 [Algibacter amylolyticus]TSJ81912.1 type II toxin-antitoxin system RelE/ParE family toxin [Algibacter amylolyticus]